MENEGLLPVEQSDRDLSWIDIAICRNAAVVADFAPGWAEYFDRFDLHVEDCIDTSVEMPKEPGFYRWSEYAIKYWDEDDPVKLSGGKIESRLSHAIHEPASVMREEAAKVAETFRLPGGNLSDWIKTNESPAEAQRRLIAAAIRNLPLSDGVPGPTAKLDARTA